MPFDDEMTLREARDLLRELVEHGHRCPCCTQFAKVYRRKLPAASVRTLAIVHRHADREWVHVSDLLSAHAPSLSYQGGYATISGHWGLLEEETTIVRDDGGRAGYWRITDLGIAFLRRRATVPKYVRLYDGRRLGFDGPQIGADEALGTRFRLDELMADHGLPA